MSAETVRPSGERAPLPPPERTTGCGGTLVALVSIGIGSLYLLNPFAGIIEFLPDNWPIVGNLDEAGAAGMVIFGLQYLGRRRGEKRIERQREEKTA